MLSTNSQSTSEPAPKRRFDFEDRAFRFAKDVRSFIYTLPRSIANNEDIKQLVRSSGSIGANYIEANESLGKKDFVMHLKIARKEAKETVYWLKLLDSGTSKDSGKEGYRLECEATELMLILSAMIRKAS
ncbi:MAG: S23 ribosomal protein [Parcubacteria group bacterium Greene0714_7]|nr:MAG: S23 ribosomal protein [Parcubacteria group bacterium Greene0714_7]